MVSGSAGLLLAAAAGYWVLERAQAQKKGLKRAGKFIGWVIVLVSLLGIACRVCAVANMMCKTQGSMMCPMPHRMGKTPPPPPAEPQ